MFLNHTLSPCNSKNYTGEPMAVCVIRFIFKASFFILNVFQIRILILILLEDAV